jgi:hypothetical protein
MSADMKARFESVYREELQKLMSVREETIRQQPAEPMRWLAIAPAWTLELAQVAGFPAEDAGKFFEKAAEQGFCTTSEVFTAPHFDESDGSFTLGEPETVYSMPPARAKEIIEAKSTGPWPSELPQEVARVGRSVLEAARKNVRVHPTLRTWAEVAARADSDASSFLLNAVEKDLGALDFTAAARWIEAATPLEKLLDGSERSITESLYLASLRYELQERQQDAGKNLDRFVERAEQMEAFHRLLNGPDAEWALHYVGAGGMGKTMLMRHLQVREVPRRNGSVAHVDFDYLNPEFPSSKPALLLVELAEELRLHDKTGAASDYFESFSRRAVTLHEGLTAGARLRSPLLLVRDSEFQELLDVFASAASSLPQPVVLILDTCEELSKMQSDGSVPENVTATFEILEGLQKRLTALRVIFSGRRPLASSGAGGWSVVATDTRFAGGIPRSYLRVHEVRGFTCANAEEFLEKSQCPKHLVEPILERCPERGYTPQFRWKQPVAPTKQDAPRFSPYELSLYASWLGIEPELTADAIRSARFDQYVKARIIGRLRGEALRRVLPGLSWLGRFDDATVLALAGLEAESDEARTLLTEILRQEWIERQGGPFVEIERGLRPLLFEYYRKNDPALLDRCRMKCVAYLEQRTESAALNELDTSQFEGMVRMTLGEPERAAQWWARIEERVLLTQMYAFLLPITRRLLAPDLWADLPAESKCILAAVAATHAAAEIHTGTDPAWTGTWKILESAADRHPIPETVRRLKTLACIGTGRFTEINTEDLDEQSVAALVRVLERDASTIEEAPHSEALELAKAVAGAPVSVELHAYCALFRARALARRGEDLRTAMWLYKDAFMKAAQFRVDHEPWLYWPGSDDSASRLKLEFLRDTYPHLLSPRELHWIVDIPFPLSVDADRCGSAMLAVQAALAPIDLKVHTDAFRHSAEHALDFEPAAEAHFAVPPLFVLGAEEHAWAGQVPEALGSLQDSSSASEGAGDAYSRVEDADRARARILRAWRLLEQGYYVPDSILKSDVPDDVCLRSALDAFRPDSRLTEKFHGAEDAGTLHSFWRCTRFGDMPRSSSSWSEALRVLQTFADEKTFRGMSCALDIVEVAQLAQGELPIEPGKPSERDIARWWKANHDAPVEAFTLWIRRRALLGGSRPNALMEQIGRRRAARIALDEGELLALRLPDKAVGLLRFARRQFERCDDAMGKVLASANQGLAYAQLHNLSGSRRAVRRLRSAFHAGEPESGTFLSPETWERIDALVEGIALPEPSGTHFANDWMRPWMFRIAACLAFGRDGKDSGERRRRVAKEWRAVAGELPFEVAGWLEPQPAAPVAAPSAFPAASMSRQLGPSRIEYRISTIRSRSSGSLFESASIRVESDAGISTDELHSPPVDLPYAELYQKLPFPFVPQRMEEIVLTVDRGAAWICWEALFQKLDVPVYRKFVHGRHKPMGRMQELPRLFALSADPSSRDLVSSAKELGLEWTCEQQPERLTSRLSPGRAGHILYLIGDPLETRSGLRIQLVSSELAGSNAQAAERGRLISADEASRLLPDIRLAILQCPTRRRSVRTGVYREKASYLRSFAAELHAQVPLVVTLPTLDLRVGIAVSKCLLMTLPGAIDLAAAVANGVHQARQTLREFGPDFDEERCDISFYGDLP